jgi:AraC-like DNA-binding protein
MTLDYQGGHSARQLQKSWTGVSANLAEMHCDGSLDVDLGAACTQLSVVLEEVGGRFEVQSEGWRGQRASHDSPQPLSIIPEGVAARGRAEGLRFVRHLVLAFDVAALGRMVEGEIDVANVLTPRPMFADPGIMRLGQLFAEECETDQPHSGLYGDNLSMALLLALSRLTATEPRSIKHGQLAPWQLRRVTDYLAANLADDIPLQTLSDLVKLSRSYFSRAFKVSTGLAPHQWLLQARISKAKQLLLETDRPLAQVAIDVGFADQAHFTRTFRREAGESPGAWQRARWG